MPQFPSQPRSLSGGCSVILFPRNRILSIFCSAAGAAAKACAASATRIAVHRIMRVCEGRPLECCRCMGSQLDARWEIAAGLAFLLRCEAALHIVVRGFDEPCEGPGVDVALGMIAGPQLHVPHKL